MAAPPTLDAMHPAGGTRGSTELPVIAVGKIAPWPVQVWCSNCGVTFRAEEKTGNFLVSIEPDASLGPCWVRLYNEEGVSEPRLFVVSALPEMTEAPDLDNNVPSRPMSIESLPVVVNGRLEKSGDVDVWQISLEKGQRLRARLDGYALRTGVDPFLHLYDPEGTRILLASDHARNLDPRLDFEADQSGDYGIAVMGIATPPNANVTFHGSSGAVYRLGLAIDDSLRVEKSGVADGETAPLEDDFPPESGESLPLPLRGFGTLASSGAADRIPFFAAKGQSIEIAAEAMDYGFPTDPVLLLEKLDGTSIRETDDTKPDRDAIYLYRVPADGDYAVRVRDRFGRGGEGFRYSLRVGETEPSFSGSLDQSSVSGSVGEEIAVKWKIFRIHGHAASLQLKVEGLPPGVDLSSESLGEKETTGELILKVGEEAAPFSGPIRIKAMEAKEGEEVGDSQVLPFSFQDSNARGPYLRDEIADLWLTILPKTGKMDKEG